MEDLAKDCAAFIRVLGYERVHIFGSSYGGALALQIAISVPDVVQTLTVGATVTSLASAQEDVGPTLQTSDEARHQMMLNNLLSVDAQNSKEQVAECLADLVRRTPEQHERRMAALYTYDVTDKIANIKAPTLLIYGEDDPLARPDRGRQIAAAIPGAHLEVLPKIRHGLTLEGKRSTAALLRDFVLAHPLENNVFNEGAAK